MEWLKARRQQKSPPAFGWQDKKRFTTHEATMAFVEGLYAAGNAMVETRASAVWVQR